MLRTVKLRLLPTVEQEALFIQYVGTSRFIWNYFLKFQNDLYSSGQPYASTSEMGLMLKSLKEEYTWLSTISHHTLLGAIRDLNEAFQLFFKGFNNSPKFKRKRCAKQSFYSRNDRFYITVDGDAHLDKIGVVKIKRDTNLPRGLKAISYKNVRVLRENNKWYVYVSIECERKASQLNGVMGIDLGVRNFVTAYLNGNLKTYDYVTNTVKYNKYLRKQRHIIKVFYRKIRKHPDSVSHRQLRYDYILRRLKHRMQGLRRECLFNIVNDLCSLSPMYIVMEHLDKVSMQQTVTLRLRTALESVPFYNFKRLLKSKCDYLGISLHEVSTYFPSTRKCSNCGTVLSHSLIGHDYICKECNMIMDRDANAAINLSRALSVSKKVK